MTKGRLYLRMVLMAGLVFFSACTTPDRRITTEENTDTNLTRVVSSIESDEESEIAFQRVMSSPNLVDAIQLKLDQIEEAYYRTQDLLVQFDQMLTRASDRGLSHDEFMNEAIESGIYPRLLALQNLGNEVRDRLKYYILRLVEIEADPKTNSETKMRITQVMQHLEKYLREVPRSTRVALNQWAEEMYIEIPDSPVLKRGYARLLVGKPDEIQKLMTTPNNIAHQEQLIQSLRLEKNFFTRRLDDLEVTFKEYARDSYESTREPQSEKNAHRNWAVAIQGGPYAKKTELIVNSLRANKTPASFFFVGQNVKRAPSVVAHAKRSGLLVGHSSETEREMPKLFDSEIPHELTSPMHRIQEITGAPVRYFMAPYQASLESPRLASALRRAQLLPVKARIDSLSWADYNSQRIVERVKKQAHMANGGVILFTERATASSIGVPDSIRKIEMEIPHSRFMTVEGYANEK